MVLSMTIILGIDPGLNTTGYGVIDVSGGKVQLVEAGVVNSTAKELSQKINEIYTGVVDVIETLHPKVMAVEQLYTHYDRPTTAVLMAHARGAIYLAAAQHEIPVVPFEATKIKKIITGNGRASKDQIQRAIQLELHLKSVPEPPDVADALAVALCQFYHGKINVKSGKPHSASNQAGQGIYFDTPPFRDTVVR